MSATGQLLLVSSVNGLVCFCEYKFKAILICNPTVRRNVTLEKPKHRKGIRRRSFVGSGLALFLGNTKWCKKPLLDPTMGLYEFRNEVYTLGTGRHYTVLDQESPQSMCCFDIEKELFQLVPSPPHLNKKFPYTTTLGLWGGYLYVCKVSEIVVWVME